MSTDNRPTKKQRELLTYIDGFIKTNGYGPSYREVMRALDYKSVSTVATHIDGLIARGYLRKRDNSARTLEVIAFPQAVTPSEDAAHEIWLESVFKAKLQKKTLTNEEYAVLISSLKLLGYIDIAKRLAPASETPLDQRDEQ